MRVWIRAGAAAISAAALSLAVAGCGGSSAIPGPPPTPRPTPPPALTPVKHIIIVIQENRSVDNLFNGFPGADTVRVGEMHDGTKVALHPASLNGEPDPCHSHTCWLTDYNNGAMNGWDLTTGSDNPPQGPLFHYGYVPRSEVVPYWTLASQYTLADRMFQSNTGPSYPAHQYLVAGQSADASENPDSTNIWGCDSPPGTTVAVIGVHKQDKQGPFPCFDYPTLADVFDQRGVTWRYYAPSYGPNGSVWNTFDANRQVRFGSDWGVNDVTPETRFFKDLAAGQLAQVTWIAPSCFDSDHASCAPDHGPDWVASIVNAVGTSQFWNDTAIFVTWDDNGGWYDHVNPPQLDEMGLGFRVPLLVVSPFAKRHYVSKVQHEFGSIVRFAEEDFGLPPITAEVARSDDLKDCFDFTHSASFFAHIPTTKSPDFFIHHHPPDGRPPDDL